LRQSTLFSPHHRTGPVISAKTRQTLAIVNAALSARVALNGVVAAVVKRSMSLHILVIEMFFVIIAYKLRSIGEDAFGIKRELKHCALFALLATFSFTILDVLMPPIFRGIAATAEVLPVLGILYFTLIVPVRESYVNAKYRKEGQVSDTRLKQFEDFLLYGDGAYDAFLEFARKELSTENVIFWKRCHQYDGTLNDAIQIYKHFLSKRRWMEPTPNLDQNSNSRVSPAFSSLIFQTIFDIIIEKRSSKTYIKKKGLSSVLLALPSHHPPIGSIHLCSTKRLSRYSG
jgi:hypothetical protein